MSRIAMKNIISLCSVVALLCVSIASVFHIVLTWRQIEEIDIARYKKMKLNAFFQDKLSSLRCSFLEIEKQLMSNDKKSVGWQRSAYLNEREKEIEEEMKRCGYTTLDIERLKKSADLFGSVLLKLSNLDKYRKEQKEFGHSDEEIEKDIDGLNMLFFESTRPFSLN